MFVSAAMRELDARLGHLIEMSGIGLVTGDSGSGKSTACRAMAARLHTGLYKVFYVPLSTGNPMDLYKSIAWEMGLPTERSRAALYRQIRNEVTRLGDRGAHPPRAHPRRGPRACAATCSRRCACSPTTRWTPRTASACSSAARPSCAAASAWPCTRRSASASSSATTCRRSRATRLGAYLTHLLRRAGTELPLFEPAAVEAIFQATQGLPRKINCSPITPSSPPRSPRRRP